MIARQERGFANRTPVLTRAARIIRATVGHELQSPRPASAVRRGEKPPSVEPRPPLLAEVARLPTALDGESLMPLRLIRRADARPGRGAQPLRHTAVKWPVIGWPVAVLALAINRARVRETTRVSVYRVRNRSRYFILSPLPSIPHSFFSVRGADSSDA